MYSVGKKRRDGSQPEIKAGYLLIRDKACLALRHGLEFDHVKIVRLIVWLDNSLIRNYFPQRSENPLKFQT